MSNEVVTRQENAVSTDVVQWGDDVNVGKDLLISKVLTMQPMSIQVTEDGAKIGEFRDSLTKELYGDIASSRVEFIPFHVRKMWSIQEKKAGEQNYEWVKTMPVIEDPTHPDYNDNLEWNVTLPDGTEQKRIRRLDFFCLLLAQVKTATAMPVTISFQSTSYKAGQILLNLMYVRNKMAKKSPAGVIMALTGEKVKNDKNQIYVQTAVVPVGNTPAEYVEEAKYWYNMIAKGGANVVVDESDNGAATAQPVSPETQSAGRF